MRVRYAETDKMGVVYYANYFVWFEIGRTDLLRHSGWSYREMEAEGFGLPVLEAMACGAPVITSDTSSLPEVAGDAALLVDPRDVDALAAAIERLMGDATLRAELRERGLARAREFSWERTARETAAVYRAACDGGRVEERSEV